MLPDGDQIITAVKDLHTERIALVPAASCTFDEFLDDARFLVAIETLRVIIAHKYVWGVSEDVQDLWTHKHLPHVHRVMMEFALKGLSDLSDDEYS